MSGICGASPFARRRYGVAGMEGLATLALAVLHQRNPLQAP
jgi:hypothetical protein